MQNLQQAARILDIAAFFLNVELVASGETEVVNKNIYFFICLRSLFKTVAISPQVTKSCGLWSLSISPSAFSWAISAAGSQGFEVGCAGVWTSRDCITFM
jgi:hypothetical protein